MSGDGLSRRAFLARSGVSVGGMWVACNWPLLASAGRAAASAQARTAGYANLSVAQAVELEAVVARIIPSGDTPGATEAGVIYFIDAALGSFASAGKESLATGLDDLQQRVRTVHGDSARFSDLETADRIDTLRSIEDSPFFGLIRYLTVAGMFSMPSYGGNRDKLGWQLVGFQERHHWQPPFGYYDAQAEDGEADG